jgi:hypothetical protein
MRRALVCVVVLLLSRSAVAADWYLLVVTGVPGDQEHAAKFQKWTAALIETATQKYGVPPANIMSLGDGAPAAVTSRGRADAESVRKAMANLAGRARPADELFVVLIGHGSFDGRQASFNLPGPDLSAADYAKLLEPFRCGIVFVNTASASGPFVQALAGPGRTVITATRTGGERNETRFGEFFIAALADAAADRDHDGRVSMLEAFDFARAQVERAYQQEGLVLTEHATLEDGNDGRQAAATVMRGSTAVDAAAAADPALRALTAEKEAIEDEIASLKLKKDAMPADVYAQELERLVTALAVKTRAIKEREAKK